MRKRAKRALWRIEEAGELLNDIVTTDDPEVALAKAEELHYEYGRGVPIPDDLWIPDFFTVVHQHKMRYDQLRSAGLLGAHAAARREITQRVVNDLAPKMPLSRDTVYVLHVNYDEDTFRNLALRSELRSVGDLALEKSRSSNSGREDPVPLGLISHSPGEIVAYLIPGRIGYDLWMHGTKAPDDRTWTEKLNRVATSVMREVVNKMLAFRSDLQGDD